MPKYALGEVYLLFEGCVQKRLKTFKAWFTK